MDTMKAVAFRGIDSLVMEERPKPCPRAGQAVIRVTTTTICGTDHAFWEQTGQPFGW